MFRILLVAILCAAGAGCAKNPLTESFSAVALDYMSDRYRMFVVLEESGGRPLRYVYADRGPHLHAYSVQNGRPQLEWENTELGSPVSALIVRDLGRNGTEAVIVATADGRVLAYDSGNFNLLFENFEEPFARITCLIGANIDEDIQDEIIFIGQAHEGGDFCLHVYDGISRTLEWKTLDDCYATELLVANVDRDEQLEIILNSGSIVDSRFRSREMSKFSAGGFGRNMKLLDINGDGYPEIIGEIDGFTVKIFDVYSHVEIW